MLKYILRRLLIFTPTLFVIALVAFLISVNAPADPVERLLKSAQKEGGANEQSSASKKVKQQIRKKLGLDLPVFYFALATLSDCDTLYKIDDKAQKDNLGRLCRKFGNWKDIQEYRNQLIEAQIIFGNIDFKKLWNGVSLDSNSEKYSKNYLTNIKNKLSFSMINLLETSDTKIIKDKLSYIKKTIKEHGFLSDYKATYEDVETSYNTMVAEAQPWKTYIPAIFFYPKNQFSRWLFGEASWFSFKETDNNKSRGALRGDFGISYIDSQPIHTKIWEKFQVSFIFVILSIILAYLVSIPVGIYSAYKRDKAFDRYSSVVLFILYSMPNFFIGTLLLYTFANPDVLLWFPVGGFQNPSIYSEDWGFFKKAVHHIPYIILPLITYSYSSFAFLSRIMRVGMLDVLNQDYIRTARAKGLTEKTIVLKHVLRNSLLPIITVFANIFPLAIGGSVLVETIFSLPGMGFEAYNAVLNYDYPMIVAIFTISGFLTVLGYLVADILYAVADPRISYA